MSFHRHLRPLAVLAVLSIIPFTSFSQTNWEITHATNIVDTTATKREIAPCTAVVMLSRNQCSHCGEAMPELVEKLISLEYAVLEVRVLDSDVMTCKDDELAFKALFPGQDFVYLKNNMIQITSQMTLERVNYTVKETPAILLIRNDEFELITSNRIVDDFGRLKKVDAALKSKCKG